VAVEQLAGAVDALGGQHQSPGVVDAGVAAQSVINQLHGAPAGTQMSTGDGLGGGTTGGAE